MGGPQRSMGRDIQIDVVKGGEAQAALTAIKSMEWTNMIELKTENFLGRNAPDADESWEGAKIRLELQLHSKEVLALIRDLIKRAQRQIPDFRVNITATFLFADGPGRVSFPDLRFSNVPVGVPARSEYATLSLDGFCSMPKL